MYDLELLRENVTEMELHEKRAEEANTEYLQLAIEIGRLPRVGESTTAEIKKRGLLGNQMYAADFARNQEWKIAKKYREMLPASYKTILEIFPTEKTI